MKKIVIMAVLFMVGFGVAGWQRYEREIESLKNEISSDERLIEHLENKYASLSENHSELLASLEKEYGGSFYPLNLDSSETNPIKDIYIPFSVKDVIDLREGKKVHIDFLFELGNPQTIEQGSHPTSVVWTLLYKGEELVVTTDSVTTKLNSRVKIPMEIQLKGGFRETFYNQSVKMQLKYEIKQ